MKPNLGKNKNNQTGAITKYAGKPPKNAQKGGPKYAPNNKGKGPKTGLNFKVKGPKKAPNSKGKGPETALNLKRKGPRNSPKFQGKFGKNQIQQRNGIGTGNKNGQLKQSL